MAQSRITVQRLSPHARLHIDALRGALVDGRLLTGEWAAAHGLNADTVMRWLAGAPIQESDGPCLTAAALVSSVPGWQSARAATETHFVSDAQGHVAAETDREHSRAVREHRLQQQSEAWESILKAADVLLALGALNLQEWQRLFDAGGPVQGAWRMALQTHDIGVVLYYVLSPGSPRDHVASTLRLSADDVAESLARLKNVGLLRYEIDRGLAVAPTLLLEFLSHGVRVAFPAVLGERVRGLGTAYVQSLVEAALTETEVAVWPAAHWGDEGRALYPLLPAAADIADRHPRLYALLAAVDAIRLGRPCDALVARAFLAREILGKHEGTGKGRELGGAEKERDEVEARWHEQLRQLWLLSKRLEEQRRPQPFFEFLATPQPILAGPHGTSVSPNAAVLTGDLERVLWLLEWVTAPADEGAPLRPDGEANIAGELHVDTTRHRVLRAATACFGSEEKADRWLASPNRALAGALPYRLLNTEEGARLVLQIIGRIEHGVIS